MQKVETFFERLNKDEKLRLEVSETLKNLNKTEKENEKAIFEKVIAPLAQKHGFDFNYQDYVSFKKNLVKNGKKVSDVFLKKVNGGILFLSDGDNDLDHAG